MKHCQLSSVSTANQGKPIQIKSQHYNETNTNYKYIIFCEFQQWMDVAITQNKLTSDKDRGKEKIGRRCQAKKAKANIL